MCPFTVINDYDWQLGELSIAFIELITQSEVAFESRYYL